MVGGRGYKWSNAPLSIVRETDRPAAEQEQKLLCLVKTAVGSKTQTAVQARGASITLGGVTSGPSEDKAHWPDTYQGKDTGMQV